MDKPILFLNNFAQSESFTTTVGGWWKTRKSEQCMEKETRYSLIVSLHTEAQEVDIYTPVANRIGIPTVITN